MYFCLTLVILVYQVILVNLAIRVIWAIFVILVISINLVILVIFRNLLILVNPVISRIFIDSCESDGSGAYGHSCDSGDSIESAYSCESGTFSESHMIGFSVGSGKFGYSVKFCNDTASKKSMFRFV